MGTSTIARIRTIFTGVAGTPWYSNFYFDDDGTAAGVYQTKVLAFWTALVPGHMRSGITATMVNPIPIMTAAGSIVSVVTGAGGSTNGSQSVDPLPPATQALLRLHTGVFEGGREIRGRVFVPGLTEADNSSAGVSSTLLADMSAAAASLQGSSGANGAWVVWSKKNASWAAITSWSGWNQFAVMRSRRD